MYVRMCTHARARACGPGLIGYYAGASASYSQVVVEVVSGLITVYSPVLVCSMFELVVINKTCPATMSMECSKHKLLISMLHYTYSVSV